MRLGRTKDELRESKGGGRRQEGRAEGEGKVRGGGKGVVVRSVTGSCSGLGEEEESRTSMNSVERGAEGSYLLQKCLKFS